MKQRHKRKQYLRVKHYRSLRCMLRSLLRKLYKKPKSLVECSAEDRSAVYTLVLRMHELEKKMLKERS